MILGSTPRLATMALQSNNDDVSMIFAIIFMIIALIISVVAVSGKKKIFVKAGHPGWKSLIPIYDVVLWLEMIGRPWWYVIALFFPGVNAILWIILAFGTARSFGRDILFALGVTFLPFIFIPVLGFGKAKYIGGMGPSYRRGPQLA